MFTSGGVVVYVHGHTIGMNFGLLIGIEVL